MRIIKEIPAKEFKITLFAWNNRYLIKLEQGLFEQTYKIDQFDIENEDAAIRLIDEPFIAQATQRFRDMAISLNQAMSRLS